MAKFFGNQNLDEAGIVGINLQKLLIFFMLLDVVWLFCGGAFLPTFMSLLFHFVVFMGVYRRRTAVLLFYVICNVAVLIFAVLALILVVSALFYVAPLDDSSSSDAYTVQNSTSHLGYARTFLFGPPANHTKHRPTPKPAGIPAVHPTGTPAGVPTAAHPTGTPAGGPTPAHPSVYPHPIFNYTSESYSSDSVYYVSDEGSLFLSVVALLVSVIILYCKVLSIVLAHRMRKLLLAGSCVSRSVQVDSEAQKQAEPVYIPAEAYENGYPMFNNQGYMPYHPMVPPQNLYPGQEGAMMQPPFMYGQQQPVFYTFAPMPPNNENDEKL